MKGQGWWPCSASQGSEKTLLTLLRGGLETYKWFSLDVRDVLDRYREGEFSKKEASERIANLCVDKRVYRVFHIVDVWEEGRAVDRRLFRTDKTFGRLLHEAQEKGQALLYRGMFAIPEAVWREYKENYGKANRFKIFKLDKLVRLAPFILMDLDAKDGVKEEDVKRLIKYLHLLQIFPEVWRSPSGGFHVYIHLVGQVRKLHRTAENGEREEVTEHYLPYANDFRLKLVIKALKNICRRLKIPYDSISCDRAVWMEGIENPLKGGKRSERILDGAVHRLDKLFERLRPIWEREIREEAWRRFEREILRGKRKREAKGSVEIQEAEHSNPIDYLQENVSYAFRMLDRGYTWAEIEEELRARWNGDERAFDRAFPGFREFVERVYRPPKKEKENGKPKGHRNKKHRHYWEYIPILHEVLKQDRNLSIRELSRRTGIPKSSLADIFRLVSREQVLNSPEEAQEYLKACAKGGDNLSEERKKELREKERERWLRYFEETLKKSLSPKGKKGMEMQGEGLGPVKSVRIGHRSITPFRISRGEDGKNGKKPFTTSHLSRFKNDLSWSEKDLSPVFSNRDHAIAYLERMNGKYALGDRVKLWVRAPNGEVALYEFEKVIKRRYRELADTEGYEVETWELKTIHWNLEDRNGEDSSGERVSSGEDSGGHKEEWGGVQGRDKGKGKGWGSSYQSDIQAPREGTSEIHEGAGGEKGEIIQPGAGSPEEGGFETERPTEGFLPEDERCC